MRLPVPQAPPTVSSLAQRWLEAEPHHPKSVQAAPAQRETARQREALRRHVRALSAEGRLSAYILVGLPPLVIVLMLVIRRPYMLPLFTTAVGLFLLILAGVLVTLGGLWMWRLIKVEV